MYFNYTTLLEDRFFNDRSKFFGPIMWKWWEHY